MELRVSHTLNHETQFVQHIVGLMFYETYFENHRFQAQYYNFQL